LPELMAKQTATVAILFADISGSTRLYENLGDTRATEVVAQCLESMTRVVRQHGGTVVKTIGDEVMCTFPSAEAAVEAATNMQEEVCEALPARNPRVPPNLSIRVGLHFGSAIFEAGDVFGDAVNTAARMAGQAKGGQIITTQLTVDALPAALQANTRCIDQIPVKGKREHIQIHEVIWKDDDVTHVAPGLAAPRADGLQLRLRYHKHALTLGEQSGTLVMGRGKEANLVIKDRLASREHARIEYRRGRFVLTDQSTNGTYVMTPAGPLFLRREEMTLFGKGEISLGRSFDEEPTEVVLFEFAD